MSVFFLSQKRTFTRIQYYWLIVDSDCSDSSDISDRCDIGHIIDCSDSSDISYSSESNRSKNNKKHTSRSDSSDITDCNIKRDSSNGNDRRNKAKAISAELLEE